jgi:hypothetical protein
MREPIQLSPLPPDHVRALIIMAAREGQAAIGRGPNAGEHVTQCFEAAASLARDYYARPSSER